MHDQFPNNVVLSWVLVLMVGVEVAPVNPNVSKFKAPFPPAAGVLAKLKSDGSIKIVGF